MRKSTSRIIPCLFLILLLLSLLTCPVWADTGLGEDADQILGQLSDEIEGNADVTELVDSLLQIDSPEAINVLLSHLDPIVLIITAAVALVVTFFGYKLLNLSIMLGGLAGGWLAGDALYTWFISLGAFDPDTIPGYVPILVSLICALTLMVLAKKIIRLGYFLLTTVATYFFLGGFSFFADLVDQFLDGWDFEQKQFVARIAVSLLVGLLTLMLERIIITAVTAAGGGMVAGFSIMVIAGQTTNTMLETIVSLVLIALGLTVQFSSHKKKS